MMRFMYESLVEEKKIRISCGSGLCATGKSFDSVDLQLNGKTIL